MREASVTLATGGHARFASCTFTIFYAYSGTAFE